MLRIIIAAIIGFGLWSVLWLGTEAIIMAILPWYREVSEGFVKAFQEKRPFEVPASILISSLIRSFIFSIISGLIAAGIAKENSKAPLLLGILLLAFGLFMQLSYWNYIPLWYHIPFLLMLIPMAVLGGKLRKVTSL